MTDVKTWRQANMEKATAKRMRASEEKKAAVLEARGWVCIPPERAKP